MAKSHGKQGNPDPSPETRWQAGQTGNKKGRPKNPGIQILRDAVNAVEKEKKENLFERFVRMAWDDPGAMKSLISKHVPDMKQIDVDVQGDVTFEVVDKYVEKSKKGKK